MHHMLPGGQKRGLINIKDACIDIEFDPMGS